MKERKNLAETSLGHQVNSPQIRHERSPPQSSMDSPYMLNLLTSSWLSLVGCFENIDSQTFMTAGWLTGLGGIETARFLKNTVLVARKGLCLLTSTT